MRSYRNFESGSRHSTDHWSHDASPAPVVAMFAVVVLVLALAVLAVYHPHVFSSIVRFILSIA